MKMKLSERLKHIDYDGYVDKIIKKLKLEKQIFIFGAGSRAQTLARFLIDNGIVIDSFFVNRKYFVEGKIINIKRQKKSNSSHFLKGRGFCSIFDKLSIKL